MVRSYSYLMLSLTLSGCGAMGGNVALSSEFQASESSPAQPQVPIVKERIAVLGLKNKARVKEDELSYLTEVLRGVASKLPKRRYSVMTEDNILVMLPPNKTVEDCQGTCAVDTGRRLGAHWVLVGSVVRFGKSLRITINLHHTKSGELRGSERIKGDVVERLERPLEGAALRLFSELDAGLITTRHVAPKVRPKVESFNERMQRLQSAQEVTDRDESASIDYEAQMMRLQRLAKEKTQLEQQMRAKHLKKVNDAWQAAKPIIKRGDPIAERALQEFINEFKDSPLGNPRTQEARDLFQSAHTTYETKARAKHQVDVEQEWDNLIPIIRAEGEPAQEAVKLFIQRYAEHPYGNPLEQIAQQTLVGLKAGAQELVQLKTKSELSYEQQLKQDEEFERTGGITWIKLPSGQVSLRLGRSSRKFSRTIGHIIKVDPFLISKTEVTWGQYQRCIEAGVCSNILRGGDCGNNRNAQRRGDPNIPVNCVTWDQARTFAKWVGAEVDLPTEAQWEYAVTSAGQKINYPWGNDEVSCYNASIMGCDGGANKVTSTCSQPDGHSAQGVCDLIGNLAEWTLDETSYSDQKLLTYASDVHGLVPSCSGSCVSKRRGRVVRGGGIFDSARWLPRRRRGSQTSSATATDIGFRVVKTIKNRSKKTYKETAPVMLEKEVLDDVSSMLEGATRWVKYNLMTKRISTKVKIGFIGEGWKLNSRSKAVLKGLAHYLENEQRIKKIVVKVHTHSRGDPRADKRLGDRRGETIKKFLFSEGISASRVTVYSFGSEKNISSNLTHEGRQHNQRVSFHIKELELKEDKKGTPDPGKALGERLFKLSQMASTKSESAPLPKEKEQLYQRAESALLQKNYREVIRLYSEFVKSYPEDIRADESLYHIAEAYYQQGRYEDSARAIQQIINEYSEENHADKALILLSDVFLAMGLCNKARDSLLFLKNKYPRSNQQRIANRKMKQLRCK